MFSWIPRRCIYASVAATLAVFSALLASTSALAVAPERPETLRPAEPVRATEATFQGVLNPGKEGGPGTYELGEYEFLYKEGGSTCAGGGRAPESPGISLGGGMEEVAQAVSGLQPNTHYTVCLLAREGIKGEEAVGPAVTFTTALPPETPETKPANPITATSVTLHGVVNPGAAGNVGSYEFLYRQSASECQRENPETGQKETEKATPTTASVGHKGEEAEAEATELLPSTTYTFCLLARNEAGETALGAPETFSTLPEPPAITGETSSDVGSTEAKLTAQIDPEGLPISYRVEYGTSEAYGSSTPEVSIPAAQSAAGVEVWLSGLEPGTPYHYRFVAMNSSHETTRDEEDQVFTTLTTPPPGSGRCPNEALRVGPSASLPDCRAYELVTPTDLGRTQDMTFTGEDHATPSGDGEQIALETNAPIEPDPSTSAFADGAKAVFSRTPEDWTMKSAIAPGTSADAFSGDLFSPDFSQIALDSYTFLNSIERSPDKTFEVGPIGGPYTVVANIPYRAEAYFVGANAGTASVPAFSNVLLESSDHALPLPAAEHAVAEGTVEGAKDVYDWAGGQLRLVNVTSAGALTSPCGAELGSGPVGVSSDGPGAVNAVSEDGSKIFFTSPEESSEARCSEPARLYMRVDGRETVEVSGPQGVTVEPSERKPVEYIGATPDGSEVFFATETPLTADETVTEQGEKKLFEYNTEAPMGDRLKLIASANLATGVSGDRKLFVLSEDGSTVYYETASSNGAGNIYRYETTKETGPTNPSFVATSGEPTNSAEPMYTTPSGEFLVFASSKVTDSEYPHGEPHGEPGAGYTELYRYDSADGSVLCVSCGENGSPAKGVVYQSSEFGMFETVDFGVSLVSPDEVPGVVQMSDDGQEVFFETTAQLVPQDTNSTKHKSAVTSGSVGLDVYEWEADGAEEGEGTGMFCRAVNGCTHLLSAGEDVGPEVFLGASKNGKNVFLASAAQLVPWATPEFTNIYDVRVDGGFPPPASPSECVTCQGVGSPPPLFSVPASASFMGAGNPVAPSPPTAATPVVKTSMAKCKRGFARKKNQCLLVKVKRKKKAKKASHDRGGR